MLTAKYLLVPFIFLIGLVVAAPISDRSTELDLLTREPNLKQLGQAVTTAVKIKAKLKPPTNGAVFWSGQKKGAHGPESVIHDAAKFAKDHGKQTLEQGLEKSKIRIPDRKENPHSDKLWKVASKTWADRSKGETHAIVGGTVRPNSIWNTVEKPKLMSSKKVTKITEHNVDTKTSKVTK